MTTTSQSLVSIVTSKDGTHLVYELEWGCARSVAHQRAQILANMFRHECRFTHNGTEYRVPVSD